MTTMNLSFGEVSKLSIYCDVAIILISQCKKSADETPKLKQWLLCLCTVINESCTRLASCQDQMTTFAAMRQLLSNAANVFCDFCSASLPSSGDRLRQKMELLFMNLYENFRRADFRCDKSLLEPILPHLSPNMSDTFQRKLAQQEADEVKR
uniref:Uncharacterized protein n=1 Tax=Romanomermis culicivorax TaxID=13658 RepID=A0A915HKE4_ROMCU